VRKKEFMGVVFGVEGFKGWPVAQRQSGFFKNYSLLEPGDLSFDTVASRKRPMTLLRGNLILATKGKSWLDPRPYLQPH
jgi:hypothetical protein